MSLHSVSCCEELAVEMTWESISAEERRHAWRIAWGGRLGAWGCTLGARGCRLGACGCREQRRTSAALPAPASRATLDCSVVGPSSDLTRPAGAPLSEPANTRLCGAARFFVTVSWQIACERDE